MATTPTPDVELSLGADETLVLFEWLSRETESGSLDSLLTDPADWAALHSLLGRLESTLAAPFRADYGVVLEAARNRLRERFPEGLPR